MEKTKKKRLKRYISWGAIAALVALLAVMPLLARKEAAADGPTASVLSAQVTRGDIPQVLRGGGTLENKGQQDVNIPTGVKITEFLVKNGDTVKAGDPVAKVDKVSVMAAITSVNETMDYLRDELEDGRDETVDSTIAATAGGRVKEIFAKEGDSVQDVMLRQGALALLSIDGLMAVKLEVASPLTTGESVTVTLPDKEEVVGRVESNLSGQLIVTVEDEGYAIGETVTVALTDGTTLGQGELYVHNAWKAIGYSGTIRTVNGKKEQTLSAGATLFTLKDTDYEGQLRHRATQHREYEQLLQRLLTMYESGYLTAPCDGVVSGVDEGSAHLLAAEPFDGSVTLLGGSDDWGNVRLMLLSGVPSCTKDETCTAQKGQHLEGCPNYICIESSVEGECKATTHTLDCIESCNPTKDMVSCSANKHKAGCITKCTEADSPEKCPNTTDQAHYKDCIMRCTHGTVEDGTGECAAKGGLHHHADCIESCAEGTLTKACQATGKHKLKCIRSCTHGNTEAECPKDAKYPHYLDCIRSCTASDDCPASKHKSGCPLKKMTFTARIAQVNYIGNTVLGVYWDKNVYPVVQNSNGEWETVVPVSVQNCVTQGELEVDNPQAFQGVKFIMAITGYDETGNAVWSKTVEYSPGGSGLPNGMAGMPQMDLSALAGMMGGFSGFGSYAGAAAAQTENLYDLEGSTLLTVTPDEGIQVEIRLDERDIAKVQEGMPATIKVEALRGQRFSGTVARVGALGEHSGSTGKFTVRIEAEPIADSLPGMSSTVTIHRETKENVLTLPVAAVSQEGAKTIVYTALDKKTGQPTAPQEITTGVSDGQNVEVFGLEEGAQVYYLYYDVLEIDNTARERQFNMN